MPCTLSNSPMCPLLPGSTTLQCLKKLQIRQACCSKSPSCNVQLLLGELAGLPLRLSRQRSKHRLGLMLTLVQFSKRPYGVGEFLLSELASSLLGLSCQRREQPLD
eukprot:gnl/TRDRNA2_/TRDRNA2_203351_c0_seq1.p1 gnl/TRDRNA2_/TRDRNA2_203351_c0~~gnl/TRDRNA2_/TRDRNA2_203351_c0_seq1.p1  ORF type:complete len:106 (-),score=0.05 gnl/TRDRNA2_/TRDRNA2_203351_c0_seq1:139-456(-)